MIIDSHCHLNYEPISLSTNEVIKRAHDIGIKFMLTISVDDQNFNSILKIIDNNPSVYGTYGIHPHEAKSHNSIKSNIILEKIKLSEKIIGIGETGLDFYYNHSEKKDQIELFSEHIDASIKAKLPLIVHTRAAEEETFNLLKQYSNNKDLKILIHCFTGSRQFATKLLDLGALISASGVITFKKSHELAETFKWIPNDRILVETDSPYLSPEPLRGKSNEPSHIIHTIKFLAKLKNLDFEDFANLTTENFFNLFGNLNEK